MGTLVGHVAPGFGFLLIGLWHLFNHIKLHALQPNSYISSAWFTTKFHRYFELYMIMVGSSLSIAMELFIGPDRHQPLDVDGTIPSNHLHNFEHSSISLSFFIYAAFSILLDIIKPKALEELTQLLAVFAFTQQFLLFHLHSADHMGVEGQYHLLLQFVVFVSLVTTLLSIFLPRSFPISFVRSLGIFLQGLWFIVMGFMLWTPELIPKGCIINLEEGHKVVRCQGDHQLHRAKALVNILFSWMLTLVAIFGTLFYVWITNVYAEKVQYWTLGDDTDDVESQTETRDEKKSFIHIGKGSPSMGMERNLECLVGIECCWRENDEQIDRFEYQIVIIWIEIDDEELARFVEHVDKDNNGIITFEEWRDFLLLYPHEATIENIYQYWERVCLVDIGEQAVIPEGISKHVHASKYLIAGGIAGAASRTATAPLDRLKVILQVQTTHTRILPAIKTIFKEGGVLGFFRGNGLNVVKVAPESAIRFYTYEMLKGLIVEARGSEKGDIGTPGRLLAGGMAGAIAQTAIYPMDLVKTRLQTYACEAGKKAPSLGQLTRNIYVREGPLAFYRGLTPSILGIIPYAGIDLAAYETLKDMSKRYILHESDPGPLTQLGCGTISGALGATCVYPLQVIRTRLQAQSTYTGMADVFWKTLKNEGPRGFYKGIFPNMLKVVPSASITYMVYEAVKKHLDLE